MKSRAIVLRTFRYNDESLITHLLTEQGGCVGMLVRISRSKRTAVRHSLFQPLAVLQVEWDERPHADLQRPKAAQAVLPFVSLPYDPHKSAMALFLADFLYYALRNEPASRSIFEYVASSIEWLDACNEGFANFHLVFLMRLTRFLGFMPNVEGMKEGEWFDLRTADFVAEQPLHNDTLTPAYAILIPKLLRLRYGTMRLFRFRGTERSQLLSYINLYYRLHLPDFPELKSLSVLKELF